MGTLQKRQGLVASVSLLLILFSLTMVSTFAYNYVVKQISNKKENLNHVAAEEKMLDLEEAISFLAWFPGGSRTLVFSNYGGQLHVEPEQNHLQINITMGGTTFTIFNSDTGCFLYELPSINFGHLNGWLRGDWRPIVNQSTAYQALMSVELGDEYHEIVTRYRPLVSSSLGDLTGSMQVNNVRVYIINLNKSEAYQSGGEFHIKATCENVMTYVDNYELGLNVTRIYFTAYLDGEHLTISVPLSVGSSGSRVNIEVVVSNIRIEGVSI